MNGMPISLIAWAEMSAGSRSTSLRDLMILGEKFSQRMASVHDANGAQCLFVGFRQATDFLPAIGMFCDRR